MSVAVNARFTTQNMTGVQRYAWEITERLGDKLLLISPRKPRNGMLGHFWEQCVLPHKLDDRLLWSPSNTGPLRVRRQVLTLHDLSFIDFPEGYSSAFLKGYSWLIPRLVKRVKHLITVSEFSSDRIHQVLGVPRSRMSVIPEAASGAFHVQQSHAVAATLRRLGVESPYLLCLGGMSRRKNVQAVMTVWASLKDKFPGVELLVLGSPSTLYQQDSVSSTRQIRFLSHVPDADMPALFQGARCFVYPSLYEGFGLPVLEAMACGTPVVASALGATPQTAGDAAVLVDPRDLNALSGGIQRVLGDRFLAEELSLKGLDRVKRFSWDSAAQHTYDVLSTHA